jgi:hypothetical protein
VIQCFVRINLALSADTGENMEESGALVLWYAPGRCASEDKLDSDEVGKWM